MFSKLSRYRKLTDVVTTDSTGGQLKSKSLRLLPEVSGTFLHTLQEVDRLDHLAYKYYKQPRKWWHICDANPEFMSPQALLGKEPLVTTRFPLTFADRGQPPWAALLKELGQKVGVEDVKVVDQIWLVAQTRTIGGKTVTVYVEHHEQAVVVIYNQMNVSTGDLADVISAVGFGMTEPENINRVGKQIIIPPDVIG
jgi:hypothetical protein